MLPSVLRRLLDIQQDHQWGILFKVAHAEDS